MFGNSFCGIAGGGEGEGCRMEVGGVCEPSCVSLIDFGDEAVRELDGGEKGLGDGALDAALAKREEDLVDGGEHGGFVDEGWEGERLVFGRLWLGAFAREELRVMVAAEFRALDCGCVATLAIVE